MKLPYYIDGDLKITESAAIIRHIARKNNLAGSTEEEKIRLDFANGFITDIAIPFVRMCYSDDFVSISFNILCIFYFYEHHDKVTKYVF